MTDTKNSVNEVLGWMVAHADLIEDVVSSHCGDEYFFRFKDDYFSIQRRHSPPGGFVFYVYPGAWKSSEEVRRESDPGSDGLPMLEYPGRGDDFELLHRIVAGKAHGVDAIFARVFASCVNGRIRAEDPKMIAETRNGLSREDVEARIADWRGRLEDLYSRIDSWRKELRPESKAEWGEVTQRLEEPMARAGVPPGPLPAYSIVDGEDRISFAPMSLWVIGGNGRVNVKATNPANPARRFMVLDLDEGLGRAGGWYVPLREVEELQSPLTRNVLRHILEGRE